MMKFSFSPVRRLLSALLCLSLIITSSPVSASEMSVQLQVSDPSAVLPVGTEITVRVLGTNTAAESLMIVDPGSRQQFLFGEEHTVKFTQPGMYILAGYGANGTDETAPGFQRCMSAFHMVTVEGNAAQGMEGSLSIEVYHNRQWQPLQNVRIRKPELLLRFTYNGQPLPEDAMLHSNVSWGVNTVSLLEGTVATDTQWTYEAADTALSLVESYSYQQYDMTVNADITLPDGQSVFACADFSMGYYSPEMQYVNQFYDENWNYGKTDMGKRLVKWLDMSPRSENRSNSGYLMLEEEIEFREDGLRKACESFVRWTDSALKLFSSMGTSYVIKKWSDHEAQKKFGPEGTKALKYYNMLGSVYNSYAQTLAKELHSVTRGAYLEENISKNICLIPRVKDIPDIAENALNSKDAFDKTLDENLVYVLSPLNDESSYLVIGNLSRTKESVSTITLTGISQRKNADGTTELLYSWRAQNGSDVRTWNIDQFAEALEKKNDFIIDISKVAPEGDDEIFSEIFQYDLAATYLDKTYSPTKAQPDLEHVIIKSQTDALGNRKLVWGDHEIDLNAKSIEWLGITDILNPSDREYLESFKIKSNWRNDPIEYGQKAADIAGIGMDIYALCSGLKKQSAIQEAYFAVYQEVSSEYIHALYTWYKQLEGSKSADAEAIRAAIMALMNDIYDSCEESLSKAAQLEINAIQTSEEKITLILDVCSFICDIPGVKEGLLHFGKNIVGLLNKPITWTVNAIKSTTIAQTTAKAASTLAQSAAQTISKLKVPIFAISVASLAMDIMLSAHFGYIESIYTVYNTKKALNESLNKTLKDYGINPSHQKAVDIIESLYLMKELKLKGENMVSSAYLSDMYNQFDLEDEYGQFILMNEILNMDSSHQLSGYARMKDNCVLSVTIAVQPDPYSSINIISETTYREHSAPLSYNGVELEQIPGNIKQCLVINKNSLPYVTQNNNAGIIIKYPSDHAFSRSTNKKSSTFYAMGRSYIYQYDGIEILVPNTYAINYEAAEEKVNKILRENNDATGDELAFWQLKAKKEWQFEQRIVWTYVTRKYIDSLPMFDRTQN